MTKRITLVADENVPLLDELFADIADIIRVPGRQLKAAQLANADALIVRSITQVDEQLLTGTPVRFVGTCTIGVDHIDQTYLAKQGITFTSAPGCNAMAVVDYVMAALLAIEADFSYWQQRTVGIVGYGEVGSRLYQRLTDNGINALVCDPFKPFAKNSLDEVLGCDVISLHVPLTKEGPHKTLGLLDKKRLAQLKAGALLINSSRGKVVDNEALLAELNAGRIKAVLDVYQEEPTPSVELLEKLNIATAHIAGYSLHGKMRGTLQVAEKFYAHFGIEKPLEDVLVQYQSNVVVETKDALADVMRKAYDIQQDSKDFIAAFKQGESKEAKAVIFDAYRKQYKNRYELAYLTPLQVPSSLQASLKRIGFHTVG